MESTVIPCLSPSLRSPMRCGVHLLCREQGPHNPCIFIGDCYRGLVLSPPFHEAADPLTPAIRLQPHPAQRCACPMHQEGPQRDIPPFTDAVFIIHFAPQSFRARVPQCCPERGASASVSALGPQG